MNQPIKHMNQQILVIDDSEIIHPLVKTILAEEAADVHSATDPGVGLTLAATICPDLILLDIDMPGMDGFEVCKRLKANPATTKCAVIFLTSHSAANEKVRGFGLGAADYVTKPFNRSELLARVRASLRTTQVLRSLESTSLLDPLTGLGNRAMFVQRISAEICLRVRVANPLSIIVMNIDHFKTINDTYGRPIGDEVLKLVGKTLLSLCRMEDVACHVGGDEFAIIKPFTTGADAIIFAERIRETLAAMPIKPEGLSFPHLAREPFSVTASFGVADALNPYDPSMIQRAGDALYQAKEEGRNRLSMASQMIEPKSAAA